MFVGHCRISGNFYSHYLFLFHQQIWSGLLNLNFSGGTKERIQAVLNLNGNILRRLVQLLTHRSPSVQHAALITIGNIVTGS